MLFYKRKDVLQVKKNHIKRLALSAVLLAIGLVLPFLTGQIPEIGSMLLPLHLPALICGFVCGWGWGMAVGFILPLLRSLLFGMPPMIPTALCMAFELAAYGAAAGVLYRMKGRVYFALIGAMLIGRIVNHKAAGNFNFGEEKGLFEYGGSTIIVLLEHDDIEFAPQLQQAMLQNCECQVRVGEVIGCKKGADIC